MTRRCFELNRSGRDWVVGDLHGCFAQLGRLLDEAEFDPANDRLFSVGDLIDRGPNSAAVLDWLALPWFHACRGNHEEMLLGAANDPFDEATWVSLNGGAWWLDLDAATRAAIRQACERLPYALEVSTRWGTVGIVHAEVPAASSWQEFVDHLERGDLRAAQTALWSRERLARGLDSAIEGIDRVVCGHTILKDGRVRVLGNVWHIDTGGFLQQGNPHFGLTLLPLDRLFDPRR